MRNVFLLLTEVIVKYRDKITKMENDIEDILTQEKEEKIMRASEIQVSGFSCSH